MQSACSSPDEALIGKDHRQRRSRPSRMSRPVSTIGTASKGLRIGTKGQLTLRKAMLRSCISSQTSTAGRRGQRAALCGAALASTAYLMGAVLDSVHHPSTSTPQKGGTTAAAPSHLPDSEVPAPIRFCFRHASTLPRLDRYRSVRSSSRHTTAVRAIGAIAELAERMCSTDAPCIAICKRCQCS